MGEIAIESHVTCFPRTAAQEHRPPSFNLDRIFGSSVPDSPKRAEKGRDR
jgi:hypothetical protein